MTRDIVFSDEEIRLLTQWATRAYQEADVTRLTARIDSPQEKAAEADQVTIRKIKEKLMRAQHPASFDRSDYHR